MQREGSTADARGDRHLFGSRSLISSLFGGFRNDPFDDPFFTHPFQSMEPFDTVKSSATRPVIKELNSDGEEEDEENDLVDTKEKKGSDDCVEDEKWEGVRSQSFSYKKVTYGGVDGVYRTSTVSRRAGSDGVVLEESKAADKTTGQAEHRISRGIQNKGHSVTRMLKPDGKVETMQILHNLNEDELTGFEESWKGNVSKQVGQWKNNEEPKKHSVPSGAASGGWDNPRLNLDKMINPTIAAATTSDSRARISSSNVGAKKVIRIPIE